VFYPVARAICRIVLMLLRRWEIYGIENMPEKGPVVVVANHTSYWDPVVVGCAFNRKIYFMAKGELFRIPLLGSLITWLGAFPVYRDRVDSTAIRTALTHLKAGRVVGLFPEGTRSHTNELLEPHIGATMIASRVGASIVPVALDGTRGVCSKVRVFIGKPVTYLQSGKVEKKPSKEELTDLSKQIMGKIADMLRKKRPA